jgi:hypothetical protein
MNKQIVSRLDRANLYLDRIRLNIQKREFTQAMANAVELGHQTRALHSEIFCQYQKILQQNENP